MSARPLGSHGTYEKLTFRVPAAVRAQAALGMALGKLIGDRSFAERTQVGVERARQLQRGSVTLRDIVYIRSYMRRHAVDIEGTKLSRQKPTKGWVSWLRWGGTPARWWAEEIYARYLGPASGSSAR